jgi:hypothetical protein
MKKSHWKFRYVRGYSAVNLKATFDRATKLHECEEELFMCTRLQINSIKCTAKGLFKFQEIQLELSV